jgi:hypothetical protein
VLREILTQDCYSHIRTLRFWKNNNVKSSFWKTTIKKSKIERARIIIRINILENKLIP